MRTFYIEVEVVESVTRIYSCNIEVEDDEGEDEARDVAYDTWYEYGYDDIDCTTESVSIESCEEDTIIAPPLPTMIGGELI